MDGANNFAAARAEDAADEQWMADQTAAAQDRTRAEDAQWEADERRIGEFTERLLHWMGTSGYLRGDGTVEDLGSGCYGLTLGVDGREIPVSLTINRTP
jgi:hypothetical protein